MLCFPFYEQIFVINFINTGNKVLQQKQWSLPPQLCSSLKDKRSQTYRGRHYRRLVLLLRLIRPSWLTLVSRILPGEWLAEPLRVSGSAISSQDGTHHTTKPWLCYRFLTIYFSRLLTFILLAGWYATVLPIPVPLPFWRDAVLDIYFQ